ncbi:MTH865 family protein [Methanocalculus sp.]|uniref:MTH865 family protein n=1 Tax=Methanocalculus sp. TaxID=2004547 RepID=UPI00271DDA9D|nr:MTH865 family protein [Methanocalculus sp.]MDO8842482.1 MTH865 family protein [Methanocalculus sp.]
MVIPDMTTPNEKKTIRDELYSQITGALANAPFPLKTPEELLAAFPAGADTTCSAGGITLRAGDAGGLLTQGDFPITSGDQIASIILDRAGI